MTAEELTIGEYYNFHVNHTVYENAKLKHVNQDGSIVIWWKGMARVHIAAHEFVRAEKP